MERRIAQTAMETQNITYISPFLLVLVGGSILTIGDIMMKKWVATKATPFFMGGMIVYMIGLVFLAYSFKHKNIAVASTMFVIFNIITLSIVSWIYFKETLSPAQVGGIILGIGAIVCLELT